MSFFVDVSDFCYRFAVYNSVLNNLDYIRLVSLEYYYEALSELLLKTE